MEFQPVDLKELVGITLGMLVVLVPVIGATIRFSAKPLVDALIASGVLGSRGGLSAAEVQGYAAPKRELDLLSRRVLELEQEVAKLKGQPERVAELPERLDESAPVDLQRIRERR